MKNIGLLLFVFLFGLCSAQTISSKKWKDLFSYNNVLVMKEDGSTIVAATENGIFFYNTSSGEIKKLSKANGLHDVKISAFDYNPHTKTGIVGYVNGGMDVITDSGITYVVDIPIATSYSGSKKVNHVSITGNKAVLSLNYGVSIFDLDKKEFGQSAFFATGGTYEAVNEATIKDSKVFAGTASGLKVHDINVTFPVYSTWTTVMAGNITQVDSESLAAVSTPNNVYLENGGAFVPVSQSFSNIQDVVVQNQNIVVTDILRVYILNLSGQLVTTADFGESCNTAIVVNGNSYGGTKLSGIKDSAKKIYKPDGPYNNISYKIMLADNKLWVSTGAREGRYNSAFPDPRNLGFYFFNGQEWVYPSYFVGNTTVFNVLDVIGNPSDYKETFFTNYSMSNGQGIYRMEYNESSKDFDFKKLYTSGSNIFVDRPVGLVFDENNNLFSDYSFYETANGALTGIGFYDRTADKFNTRVYATTQAVQKPVYYDGKLWIALPRSNHFSVYDYHSASNFSDDQIHILSSQNGLPANASGSLSVSIDRNEDAWIGTDTGLRVWTSANSEYSNPNTTTEPIVIEQNGIPEELFRNNAILQVETDTGNYKWVSVDGGGVYYQSANGEQTLKHFTRENSPLPNNTVTDIKADAKTGKVYFVTRDGIVSYQSDVIDVNDDFGEVLVYPNPVVLANYKGNVTFRGLAMKTNIRITDAAGNLVHQGVARGGFYEWNLNNQKGIRVASGVYFVLMTNEKGTDKATAKIAVVN